MEYFRFTLIFINLYLLLPSQVIATDLSFQGTTGALNTPTAFIADEGSLTYQFNNYIEDDLSTRYEESYNHVFSIGLSRYLELGGRLTDYSPEDVKRNANGVLNGKRDLSGNIKFKLPKIDEWFPEIAVGINDFAGNAVNFRSKYIVVSDDIKNSNYSLGYASASGSNTSFNGSFASFSYDVNSNFTLLAEYDTNNFNLGANYDLTPLTSIPVSLKVSTPVDSEFNNDPVIGLSLRFPIDTKHFNNITTENNNIKPEVIKRSSEGSESNRINKIMNKLAKYGLENLKAGQYASGKYLIAVENRIYNHSYMDAVALVMGTAHEFLANSEKVQIILLDEGTAKFSVETSIKSFSDYLADGKSLSKYTFKKQLKISFPDPNILSSLSVHWFDGFNKGSSPRFDLTLQPAVKTSVGHEFGLFDYSLALQADIQIPLWKGGSVLISSDVQLDESRNYKDGKPFSKHRQESGVKQLLLQQYKKPNKNISTLSTMGKVDIDNKRYNTAQSEAIWTSTSGSHLLSSKLAYFKSDSSTEKDRKLVIGSYEYFMEEHDLSLEMSYGEFFGGGRGAHYRLKKHFGDTEVAVFIKYIQEDDIAGGISISLPLTPRRDYKNNILIVRGSPSWNYSLSTTIEDPIIRGSNRLRPNVLREPKPANTLARNYMDSNRLTANYFKAHLKKLREAYFTLSK